MDLSKYNIPLSQLPLSAQKILNQRTMNQEFLDYHLSPEIVNSDLKDGIYKNQECSYFIKCTSDMPGVEPSMIDWWFAWHLPESDRYKLWHPKDHVSAIILQDRSKLKTDKERYIGISSYVEEYIGDKFSRLCISFKDPEEFGFEFSSKKNFTAICAEVIDLDTGIKISNILHYVESKENGSVMMSYFWLGRNLQHQNKILNLLVRFFSKIKRIKGYFINDILANNLLKHCLEEMNHLSFFLPMLYKDITRSSNLEYKKGEIL